MLACIPIPSEEKFYKQINIDIRPFGFSGESKVGIFGRFRKKKEKTKKQDKPSNGSKEVSLDIEDLRFLGALVKPEELKERLKKAEKTHRQKILDVLGIDVDSKEFKDLLKLRTLRSSDPEMAEKIHQAKEAYNKVYGTRVVLKFTREELEILRESIKLSRGSWMDDLRRRLSDPTK